MTKPLERGSTIDETVNPEYNGAALRGRAKSINRARVARDTRVRGARGREA